MSKTAPEIENIRARVDDWPINIATIAEAVDAIVAAATRRESFSAVTLNVDHLVKLRRNPRFQNAYRHARFITADGAPVAWLARRNDPSVRRTTGADLVLPLAKAAANADLPIYLFGTSNRVLGKAGSYLAEHTNGTLNIAGTASPDKNFDPDSEDADRALDEIQASGAALCFVALGAPKQEIFAARAVERGINVGFVSIGAALDFLAGAQIRAPKLLQDNGLEWGWRLITNPRRLGPRYAACALVLLDVAAHQLLGRREIEPGTTA